MKNLHRALLTGLLSLIVAVLVGCTPGGGGSTAPAGSTGTAPSSAPASVAPSAAAPGY